MKAQLIILIGLIVLIIICIISFIISVSIPQSFVIAQGGELYEATKDYQSPYLNYAPDFDFQKGYSPLYIYSKQINETIK